MNRERTLAAVALFLTAAMAGAQEPPREPFEPVAAPAEPAQDRLWNLSIGTGGGGFVEFVDAFAGSGPGSFDTSRREDRFQLNARADRELHRRFRAGLAWTYNRWTEVYFSGGARVGSIDNTVHTLLADATILWVRSDHLEFYSALAAGAGRWRQVGEGIGVSKDGVTSGFAFQIRYAGLSVGNQRLRAFVDLGIGFEGLIVGGLTLRL
jgi:hypothetical protein